MWGSVMDRVEVCPPVKNALAYYIEKPFKKTRALHKATRERMELHQRRGKAESLVAETESELSVAKKTVKELALRIEESNSRAKARIGNTEELKMCGRRKEKWETGDSQYSDVMRELELMKRELTQIKLDMASVLHKKVQAAEEVKSSRLSIQLHSSSSEILKRKIEEANAEQVLVGMAKIEARREENSERFMSMKLDTEENRKNPSQEIENSKILEDKLAATLSDVDILQGGLKLVKEMAERTNRRNQESSLHQVVGAGFSLDSVMEKLEAAKKELVSIKDGTFQFMASMDIVKNELKRVSEEKTRMRKKEKKTELTIQNLNSKLLRAKAKLETTSAAEDKAKLLLSNLSLSLEQKKSEAEAAKKEWSSISEETAIMKAEAQKTEIGIDLVEERMQVSLQDLKAVKLSEAEALDNLKALTENTMENRALVSLCGSTITISKFEYEYLISQAAMAKEMADKKIAAAHAWVEALKASEKEIMIEAELLQKESRELRVKKDRKVLITQQLMSAKKVVENELVRRKQGQNAGRESLQPEPALPPRATNRSFRMAHANKPKPRSRKTSSSLLVRTPSLTLQRRKKFMPALTKFFCDRSPKTSSPLLVRTPSLTLRRRKKFMPTLTKFFRGRTTWK